MKKLLKNKWFWILLIVAFLYWNYQRNKAAANNNSNARTGDVILQPWQGIKAKVKYFVMLVNTKQANFELICQRIKEARCDGVCMAIEFGNIIQPNGSYNWSAYDFAFETAAKYNLLIDAKFVFGITSGQAFNLKSIFSEADFATGKDGKNDWNNYKMISFSSAKWQTVIYPFINAFCDRYQSYNQKGYIYCAKPVTTPEQEFEYTFNSMTDNSNVERSAFGREIPNDDTDLTYHKFKAENLKRIFGGIASILRSKGYKSMFDNGSTVDQLARKRGTYAAETIAVSADMLKENPDFDYDMAFVLSKIVSVAKRTGKVAGVEITWTKITDLNQRKTKFLEWVRTAVDWGVGYISLAFLDPSDLTSFNHLKSIITDLNSTGHLTKNVQTPQFSGSVSYTVSEMIQAGGHLNAAILNRFNAVKQSGKPVNVQLINNL